MEHKRVSIPDMLKKLDEMYQRQEDIIKEGKKLQLEYKQNQEDIDLLQTMIMHQSNKQNRYRQYVKG